MTKKHKPKPKLLANGGSFIDAGHCGSTVMYRVHDGDYSESYVDIEATVQLTDCTRMITWNFDFEDGGLSKIDEVINIMKKFRIDYLKAQKYFDKKTNEVWKYFCAFIPLEVKEKLTNYKQELMKEYYAKKIKD